MERAAIATFGAPFDVETVSASDPLAARLSEIELDVGEGPGWAAHASGTAILAPELDSSEQPGWPLFVHAVEGLGVRAVFSFPLVIGTLRIGAVDLYSDAPGPLTAAAVAEASMLTKAAAATVLREAVDTRNDSTDEGPYSRREVHQATGMVIAQLGIPADDALLLIRAHAFASGRSVRETAAAIAARTLRLEK
ncbi:ANTAR domain-containing protein [Herbiconiux liangxiaofengii]|uniref:ANTAR domain-containing protein n=1 Tax=Herbiconiux liangxiaofengii TaxID=3342795 RepID=UPI0035B877C4